MDTMIRKTRRGRKRAAFFLGALLAAAAAAVAAGSNFLVSFALDTRSRFFVGSKAMTLMEKSGEKTQEFSGFSGDDTTREWYRKICRDVYLTAHDGLKLHGYEIKNETGGGNYMILCHGYMSNANDMAFFARKFYDMGYHLLMPDARAHGQSEGRMVGMGWPERKDMLLWIRRVIAENPSAKIGLFGISMGGATVMMTAGEKLPKEVVLAVEDCGYSSVWDEFVPNLKNMFHLPAFPILNLASAICRIRAGYGFLEASAVKQVRKAQIPMLFIHGAEDKFVPFEMLDKVYEAAGCEKEKLVIAGAGHAMSAAAAPEEYWSRVQAFVETYMR